MILALAAVAVVGLFVVARHWELTGRPERYVALVVVLLVVECLVYPVQAEVPNGAFRIPMLGGSMRTLELVIAMGVVARATVRPIPRRISGTGMLWSLLAAWFFVAMVRGLLMGHDTNLVLFATGSLIGLFGCALLVSGCDVQRLVAMARTRAVIPLGAIVLLLLPSEASADPITLFGTGLGSIHVDTASVFVALGTLVVLVEWSSTTRQRWAAWAAVPLLATPFTIAQRATLLQLAATILVIGWAMAQPEWRDRMHVARLQLIKGVLVVVAAVSVVLVFHLRDHGAEVPFAGYYEDTFTSASQQESVDSRLDSFAVGIDEWSESWPFGYGLGHSFRITRTFGSTVQELAWFDNVPLDLLVRVGLVGFLLTIAALVATLRDGLRVWRRHLDGTVAAFALAAVAVLIGLSLKAVVESVLEKGKVTALMGLCAGAIAAAAGSMAPAPTTRATSSPTAPRPSNRLRSRAGLQQRDRPGQQGDTSWT